MILSRRSSSFLLPSILAILLANCSAPPPILAVQVVIGASARIKGVLVERSALVIEGENIIAAGAQADVPIPAGSNKTDLTGKHLIDVPDVGKPATFTVLVCNPEGEPSCAQKVFKHMKAGKWLD